MIVLTHTHLSFAFPTDVFTALSPSVTTRPIHHHHHMLGMSGGHNTGYFDNLFSSYSDGCNNDVMADFHIVTESPILPRLQCGLCKYCIALHLCITTSCDNHENGYFNKTFAFLLF